MFLKTKQRAGRTYFCLCIAERGGNVGRGEKPVEYSLELGPTLNLTAGHWVHMLGGSHTFRSVPLKDVLEAAETYAAENGIAPEVLSGLREAAHAGKRTRRSMSSGRRWQQEEREVALRLLGLLPGASKRAIEAAFRRAARDCHPDAGGDPAKFRALVDARNLLLGREARMDEPA